MRLTFVLLFSFFYSLLSAQIWTQDFETNGLGAAYTNAENFINGSCNFKVNEIPGCT
jgi:hypothetical protein